MIDEKTARKAQFKLNEIADELRADDIKVKLKWTDWGTEVEGELVDRLLAKKELRRRGIEVAEEVK